MGAPEAKAESKLKSTLQDGHAQDALLPGYQEPTRWQINGASSRGQQVAHCCRYHVVGLIVVIADKISKALQGVQKLSKCDVDWEKPLGEGAFCIAYRAKY